MQLTRMLAAGACAWLLAGCAAMVPLQREQAGAITRESTPADLDKALGKATVVAEFPFEANGKPFYAKHYNLQTGLRQEMTMVCTTFCFPVTYNVPITSQYVIVQRMPARSVHAWGTLEELSKDPDPEVSGIMPVLKARFEQVRKEKEQQKK